MEGKAATYNQLVTDQLYVKHLKGEQALGIVPIKDDGTCSFAAIDIDEYESLDHKELYAKVGLTYWVCLTKSGGAHLYFFFEDGMPCSEARKKLADIAALLGYPDVEVFPKQDALLIERGDVGNWINLPYFNAETTTRFAIDHAGEAIDFDTFVQQALATRNRVAEFNSSSLPEPVPDGPPCLNALCSKGIGTGVRNDALFNIAVYARKKDENRWKEIVDEYNQKYINPPLSSDEVVQVIKSADRKNYEYTCTRAPIVNYCNATVCRTKKFGVGGETHLPDLRGLTKLDTRPPIWFLDVDGTRMELKTDDLQSQIKFQKRCMETINRMPPGVNKVQWNTLIQTLLDDVHVIEVPQDESDEGLFYQHMLKYLTGRAQAQSREDVMKDKPYHENGHYWFTLGGLKKYLERQRFFSFGTNQIVKLIKDFGCTHTRWSVTNDGNRTNVNIWRLAEERVKTNEDYTDSWD